jgi:hypothetical protein
MHPLIAYDLAKIKIADLQHEADQQRLAAIVRDNHRRARVDEATGFQPRWFLRRLLARLSPAGAGA